MTHTPRPRPDPLTLAANLRLWVVELAEWLAELLGEGSLCRSLKRWAHEQLRRAEQGAAGLAVMMALHLLPAPLDLPGNPSLRPGGAPRGFARVRVRGNDIRRVTRHLFPRERDLIARAQRLGDFLAALAEHAHRLTRRIARIPPVTRIAMIAPRTEACAAGCVLRVMFVDSS